MSKRATVFLLELLPSFQSESLAMPVNGLDPDIQTNQEHIRLFPRNLNTEEREKQRHLCLQTGTEN